MAKINKTNHQPKWFYEPGYHLDMVKFKVCNFALVRNKVPKRLSGKKYNRKKVLVRHVGTRIKINELI